ncbi:thioredoxin domain-containing protein 11 [Orussus abietinus]|uniref:thioredoxin domain-containing protein 11 n=1 Tax=Orussus abietinus TaxID=222816 RepID=UPI0006260CF0|nr:thioredoxin domain-containing protein 11 [Orussus abietinus]
MPEPGDEREEAPSSPGDSDDTADRLEVRATSDPENCDVAPGLETRSSVEERLIGKMFLYARDLTFVFALLFTALAALTNPPPKVSKPPTARPFFDRSSTVLDFYEGHLEAAWERIADADVSFVMYYAPWDAESQSVKHEFEAVARYYHAQVCFVAINCWHPGSQCRQATAKKQNIKILAYPVLMLYLSTDSNFKYKGIPTAPYMIRFLAAVLKPVHRLTNKNQLVQLFLDHDAVLLGFFNFMGPARAQGYKEFYKAAVRSLQTDPNRELAFAVVTDAKSAQRDYSITKFPSARLLIWNEFLSYPGNYAWTADNLLIWVNGAVHQPTLWIQPPGGKSWTISSYVRDGPVLFLFTPRNPLHRENYNYNLMREIGLRYYNSANDSILSGVVSMLEQNRLQAREGHRARSKTCLEMLNKSRTRQVEPRISVSIQQWINDSCCANVVINKCLLCKADVPTLGPLSMCGVSDSWARSPVPSDRPINIVPNSDAGSVSENLFDVCKEKDVFTISPLRGDQHNVVDFCCNNDRLVVNEPEQRLDAKSDRYTTSLMSGENDPLSSSAMKDYYVKEECRMLLAGNDYHPPVFPNDSPNHPIINFSSAVTKVNKTLALIALDSLYYFPFAEGLGINVSKRRDKTAVVIVDSLQESQYVMEGDLSRYSLISIINNYTEGLLRRTLRSAEVRQNVDKHMKNDKCKNSDTAICIPELTTRTFLETVLDPTQDVVVMYHTPYCAFCSAIAHVYLIVAHFLSKMDHLRFVRIDGENNDLPWEYSMNRYPSILFFPAKGKSDSTVFPHSSPVTVQNLFRFVLANLEGDSQVEALINVCHHGADQFPDDCIAHIRKVCLDAIGDLLRHHRKLMRVTIRTSDAASRRRIVLRQLEHVREVHLILGSVKDLRKEEKIVQSLRRKYSRYYKSLASLEANGKRVKSLNDLEKGVKSEESIANEDKSLKDEL